METSSAFSRAFSRFAMEVSAPAMAKEEEASSLRRTKVMRLRWPGGRACKFSL